MAPKDSQETNLQQRLYAIRRKRLRDLIATFPSMTEFAAAVGDSTSYICRLTQPITKGRKNMGEPKARKYEVRLGLAHGWFDRDEQGRAPIIAPAPTHWPFPFPRKRWEDLPAAERRRLAAVLGDLVDASETRAQQKDTG